ncbi:hypothetical protein DERF_014660 [Dermatophagoides farinae]|uniref:Uncharacterized protein n=1 Tax=Dermatophagoides farinae TaxID=6954 RepID=A0A922HPH1_DERFA|nr:hypothetical protein DERF_014660 [Dermatophagoides farinae]
MQLVINWKKWADRLLFVAIIASIFCSLKIYQQDLNAIYSDSMDNINNNNNNNNKQQQQQQQQQQQKQKVDDKKESAVVLSSSSSRIQQQLLTAKIFLYGNCATTSMAGFYLLFRKQKQYLLALYAIGTIILLAIRSLYAAQNFLPYYHSPNIIGLLLAIFRLYVRIYRIDTRTVFQLENKDEIFSDSTQSIDDEQPKHHRKRYRNKSKKQRKYSHRRKRHQRSDIDVENDTNNDDDDDHE